MQALARYDPGDFYRTTPDLRVSEQHFAERAVTQLSQAAAPTAQGGCGNQCPGEHPGLVAAKQLHFAGPGPST